MHNGISSGRLSGSEMDGFISRVADAKPLPGGGSVAALAGCLAAALGEMLAGLTEGRKEFASADARVREIRARLTSDRKELYSLVEEDSTAYQSLLDAMRLPRRTALENTLRAEAIEKGKKDATETPLRTARTAIDVLENLRTLIEVANPNARCDAAVGAQLAFASLKGARYNIYANTRGLRDRSYALACHTEISEIVRRAEEVLRQIDGLAAGS